MNVRLPEDLDLVLGTISYRFLSFQDAVLRTREFNQRRGPNSIDAEIVRSSKDYASLERDIDQLCRDWQAFRESGGGLGNL